MNSAMTSAKSPGKNPGQNSGKNSRMNSDSDDGERRSKQRTRIARNAKIILPHRASIVHCTVQNITGSGACLKVANSYGMPQWFELTFEQGRTRRACRVIWQTADLIGVAFETETAAGSIGA